MNSISQPSSSTNVDAYFDSPEDNPENQPRLSANGRLSDDGRSQRVTFMTVVDISSLTSLRKKEKKKPTYSVTPEEVELEVTQDTPDVCTLCYSRQIVTAMVPCGHCVTCVTCARGLKMSDSCGATCPICREKITSIIRLRGVKPSTETKP
jgi:hypothetical protein